MIGKKKGTPHPTLADVARASQVGIATVSRVINGGDHVSRETMTRVMATIEELGYQPNHAARILKGEKTKTIGLIVPSIADSFFSSCAAVAQEISRAHDSLLIVVSSNHDPKVEINSLNTLIQHRVDGLLLASAATQRDGLGAILDRIAIPVVCIDRPVAGSNAPSVVSGNYKGAREATEHLIAHGYKKIVCICIEGEVSLYTIKERIRGYRHAMQDAQLAFELDASITDNKSAEIAIRKHMNGPRPPDAIFALKNLATIYVWEAFQKMGVEVPRDMALLGFDDFELAASIQPSISVVEQPIEEIARTATQLLFNQIAPGRKRNPFKSNESEQSVTKLATSLILRNSCGCTTS